MILLEGWIFDVYVAGRAVTVWIVDKHGKAHCLRDTFMPAFYAAGDPRELGALAALLLSRPWGTTTAFTYHPDPSLHHRVLVLKVQVRNPNFFDTIFKRVARLRPHLTYYDGGLPLDQMYLQQKHAARSAYCRAAVGDDHRLYGLEADHSPDAPALLPLKQMTIRFAGDAWHPVHARRGPLEITTEQGGWVLDTDDPAKMLQTLRGLLLRHDPDLVVTGWGDAIVLPYLARLSREYRIPLPLHRDNSPLWFRPPPCYFSYGLIARRAIPHRLRGRRHMDPSQKALTYPYGTPPFVAAATAELEQLIARACSRREAQARLALLLDMVRAYAADLRAGRVPWQELVIAEPLPREPHAYPRDSRLAQAAEELLRDGVAPVPGESIQYIWTQEHAAAGREAWAPARHYRRAERYDAEKYVELLVRAVAPLLAPFGVRDHLRERL